MTKRLQVLFEDEEFGEIRRAAKKRRQSVAEWVRGALRQARAADAGKPVAEKLHVLQSSGAYEFPTASIEVMLDEIGRGYPVDP